MNTKFSENFVRDRKREQNRIILFIILILVLIVVSAIFGSAVANFLMLYQVRT